MKNYPAKSRGIEAVLRGIGAVALALCLSVGAFAQDAPQQPAPPPAPAQPQGQQPADQPPAQPQPPAQEQAPPPPAYAPQDADRPPYSRDRSGPGSPSAPNPQVPPRQPASPAQPAQPVPGSLTVPAGTVLMVRLNDFLSSDKNQVGDQFTAALSEPLIVNGWVVARRGQLVTGTVKDAKKAGRVKGTSELGLELTNVTIVDGHQIPVLTGPWKASGGTTHGADAATIAGGTGLGAAIGAAADWGRGAAIGAGAGAAAGLATVLLTRGRPTILGPEALLTFKLVDPVSIDTTQSQQAFLPVTQQDYQAGRGTRGPRLVGGPYAAGPYPCGYYAPCYYPYPYAGYVYPGYVGVYSGFGWGWGPGFYGGYYGRRGFRP
jgi:hypothetical protein